MDYTKEVVDSIKPILKAYGFKKKSLNWSFENDNIVKIFNIQKSLYGKQVYLNIGIKIKSIDKNYDYTISESHISTGLVLSKGILDFENSIDIKRRCAEFQNLISQNPYNFFTLSGSSEELKEFIKASGTLCVTLTAKEYLNKC